MAAPSNDTPKCDLPDPQEVAKTYAEVARRASHLISGHSRAHTLLEQRLAEFLSPHLVQAQVWSGAAAGELPSAIWSPDWTMERLDIGRCLMVASRRPERRTLLHERLQACWEQGNPSFPATVLGL